MQFGNRKEQNQKLMEIKIQSKKFVTPSNPTPPHLRVMKLSYIDQMSPPAYTPFIFYFSAHDKPLTFDRHTVVLERSLSEVLSRYYPLAGRYIQDRILVECNDEGALFLEAEVNCQIDQLFQGEPDAILLSLLVPFRNEMTAFGAITLAIQINKFKCGGLAIGICISHRVADGVTAFSFVNDWSKVWGGAGINQEIWPSFDAGSFFPAKDTLGIGIPAPKQDGAKIVTRRFVFSGEAVSTLKAKANSCNSRVEVVAALIWKARIGACLAKHGQLSPCLLILSLNLRGKTSIPLRENSCGNLCRLVVARFDPNQTKAEFENLVSLLGDKLKSAKEECARVRNYGELMTMVGDSLKEIHDEEEKGDVDVCVVASWCRFPFYEVDFGWGKPSWFSSVHKPLEIVVLVDTKNGDGIEAWVSLKEHNMYRFQEEEAIINFSFSSNSNSKNLLKTMF